MSWLRVEDNMLDHPKWRRAITKGGDETLATWLRLVSWCSRNLTDGVVPADMVSEVAQVRSDERSKTLRALTDAGLIQRSPTGDVIVTDYLERNPSRSDVLQARAASAARKEKHRLGRVGTPESHRGTLTLRRPAATTQSPSHPNPLPIPREREPERAREDLEQPTTEVRFTGSGGVSRVYSMPGEQPPQAYLDEAVMRGVSRDQATSTWVHYFGAGLPERGVERLHEWLCQRAKERANSTARAISQPRGRGFGASPALEPTAKHMAFAKAHGVELSPIVNGLVVEGVVDALGVRGALEELGKRLSVAARKVSNG